MLVSVHAKLHKSCNKKIEKLQTPARKLIQKHFYSDRKIQKQNVPASLDHLNGYHDIV